MLQGSAQLHANTGVSAEAGCARSDHDVGEARCGNVGAQVHDPRAAAGTQGPEPHPVLVGFDQALEPAA